MKGWGAAVFLLAVTAAPAAAQTVNAGQASRLPPPKMTAQDMTPKECADLKSRSPLYLFYDDGGRVTLDKPDSDKIVRQAFRNKEKQWVQYAWFDGYLATFVQNGPQYYEAMPPAISAMPDGHRFQTKYWLDPARPADKSGTVTIFKSQTEKVMLFGCPMTRSALLMDWEFGKFKSRVYREYIHEINFAALVKFEENNDGKKREGTTRVIAVRPVPLRQ